MTDKTLIATEMFDLLVRQGHVVPAGEQPNLIMPTAYRTVPTMNSSGTANIAWKSGQKENAELGLGSKRNSENDAD